MAEGVGWAEDQSGTGPEMTVEVRRNEPGAIDESSSTGIKA